MRLAICYVSNSNPELSYTDILKILSVSQKKNIEQEIHGLLLYSDGNFFQILEGSCDIIQSIWKNIRKDKRHFSIIKVFETEVTTKPFDGYLCDFISAEEKYQYHNLKQVFDQLKSLDEKPREAAEEMLKLFLKC
ncbi:BLUF domain-containing protein [Mesonia aestuariivivens]|uniref:BLUF domain-containing protein n=1 Tax=Mesonia aestuariivivens TaxID=2796128 RepID=A0ABS6VZE6_9FLAO|nr:BLUF domain-containing protein [Mesonia aestuariivivens]MBW2960970.1 BLUF domain-containing protein [Mesonia aestuariivivens]